MHISAPGQVGIIVAVGTIAVLLQPQWLSCQTYSVLVGVGMTTGVVVVLVHEQSSSYQITGQTTVIVGEEMTVALGVMEVDKVVPSVGEMLAAPVVLLIGGRVLKLMAKTGEVEVPALACTRLS